MNRMLLFSYSLAGAACLALAACSGHGSAVPPVMVDGPGNNSESAWPISNAWPMAPFADPHVLYVANFSSIGVTEYRFPRFGDLTPIRTIAGPDTQIRAPIDMALDGDGFIYVSDRCLRHDALINVFSPLANGDVAPIRTLHLGFRVCERGMWVDSAGYIYLPEKDRQNRVPEVAVYAPGANGNAQPVRLIAGSNTLLHCPYGATTDSASDLFITDRCAKTIIEFSPTADGNVAPIAEIRGSRTQLQGPVAVKIGSDGKIYVLDTSNNAPYGLRIDVFPGGATGNVAPIAVVSPPPGFFFHTDFATFGSYLIAGVTFGTDAVNIYRTGSTITLLGTIEGPSTGLYAPVAEAVH